MSSKHILSFAASLFSRFSARSQDMRPARGKEKIPETPQENSLYWHPHYWM